MVASFVSRNGGGVVGSTGVGNSHRVWRAGEGGYHPPEISGDDGESDGDYDDYKEEDYDDEGVMRVDEYDMETDDEELTVRGLRRVQREFVKSFALEGLLEILLF